MSIYQKKSYLLLFIYSLLVIINQYFWISFTTITPEVANIYNTTSYNIGLLTIIFPIVYIIISLPVGIFIDRYGYQKAIILGSVIMTAFSLLRMSSIFNLVFVGQLGIAFAQPFLLNSSAKLSQENFVQKMVSIAIGISVISIFLGIALGTILPPLFISNSHQYYLLTQYWIIISASVSVLFIIFVSLYIPKRRQEHKKVDFLRIFRRKDLFVFYFVILIGMGSFIGLLTWADEIFLPIGYSEIKVGLISFLFIIGSILGSFIIPYLSTIFGKPKILILSLVVSAFIILSITVVNNVTVSMVLMSVLGIFFSGSFPLIIGWSSELAGKDLSGSTTSALWFFGNIGGTVIPLLMPYSFRISDLNSYFFILLIISLLLLLAIPFIFSLKRLSPST